MKISNQYLTRITTTRFHGWYWLFGWLYKKG